MRILTRERRTAERGANLVELALILPLLLLLVVGIVDIGHAFYAYISLTNAAREGARFASRYPFEDSVDDISTVVARVQGEPVVPLAQGEIAASVDGLGGSKGDAITVTATLTFPTLVGQAFGFGPLSLRSSATMRIFGIDNMTPD
jgi:hypothetical protein